MWMISWSKKGLCILCLSPHVGRIPFGNPVFSLNQTCFHVDDLLCILSSMLIGASLFPHYETLKDGDSILKILMW